MPAHINSSKTTQTCAATTQVNLRTIVCGSAFDKGGQRVPVVVHSSYELTVEETVYVHRAQNTLDDLKAALFGDNKRDKIDTQKFRCDLIRYLISAHRPALSIDALGYALQVAECDGITLRDYGAKHGVSHERVRQIVHAVQKRFHLPPRSDEKPRSC